MAVAEFEFEEEGDERVSGFGSQERIRYQMKRDTGLERYSTSKRDSTSERDNTQCGITLKRDSTPKRYSAKAL